MEHVSVALAQVEVRGHHAHGTPAIVCATQVSHATDSSLHSHASGRGLAHWPSKFGWPCLSKQKLAPAPASGHQPQPSSVQSVHVEYCAQFGQLESAKVGHLPALSAGEKQNGTWLKVPPHHWQSFPRVRQSEHVLRFWPHGHVVLHWGRLVVLGWQRPPPSHHTQPGVVTHVRQEASRSQNVEAAASVASKLSAKVARSSGAAVGVITRRSGDNATVTGTLLTQNDRDGVTS